MSYGPVLGMMAGRVKERPSRYRKFVEAGLAEDDEEFEALLQESSRSLGGGEFRAWVDRFHEEQVGKRKSVEDISFRKTSEPLKPEVVLRVVAEVMGVKTAAFRERRRDSPLRAVAATFLIRYSGLNQREVARLLEAGSGAAISKQLSRFATREQTDIGLEKSVKRIGKSLESLRNDRTSRVKS